jgi:hypothetical protein
VVKNIDLGLFWVVREPVLAVFPRPPANDVLGIYPTQRKSFCLLLLLMLLLLLFVVDIHAHIFAISN